MTFFNPLLRPILFAVMTSRTRHAIGTFLRVLPSLAAWAGLLVLLVLLYALLGVLCFGPGAPLVADDGHYFATLGRALLSLVVCLTTANFPDVMLHSYARSRASFVFFASFLLLSLIHI